jgi:hypothetical protein
VVVEPVPVCPPRVEAKLSVMLLRWLGRAWWWGLWWVWIYNRWGGVRLSDGAGHLRVLIANERKDRLGLVAAVVVGWVMR